MQIHKTTYDGKTHYLFLDDEERIVELPTDFFRSLVTNKTKKLADKTLDRYAEKNRDLGTFLEHHPVYGSVRLDDAIAMIRRPVLQDFFNSLATHQASPTIKLAEAAVRKFMDWLNTDEAHYVHERPVYPQNSAGLVAAPTRKMPRSLNADQVIALIIGAHFEAQRIAVQFMYDTGVRVSEVPRILKKDLPDWRHFPEGTMYFPLFVRGSKGRNKEYKERNTIISRPMLSRMAKYHNTHGYLFNFAFEEDEKPALLNVFNEPWTEKALQAMVTRAGNRAGLANASPHKLRHGTAFSIATSELGSSLLENLVLVQQMFGHSSIETTETTYSNIPAIIQQRLYDKQNTDTARTVFEEAQRIFDATYRPQKREPTKKRIGKKS
ncbi:tyrosine-type recombinase/integrase [Herbaspirillum sp. LeCh32-8]|uniref:tyrosine-type recombinase/integrase n=1 Tax=Herbaspirillum sp. LeCh32-8 TaxID=2821356 RepID=UPI001AE674DF|nr:tyrosine-type recombinase/integrase [Herbaspirillum sp. LeCh32-8]MBP0597763.1 tyrosine-type recombinase/integrase [Herbaspirillum sp. LeCh32-8]